MVEGKYKNQAGFVYLAVLFAITLIGLSMAMVGQKWGDSLAREREQELLSHGSEIVAAIDSYFKKRSKFPKNLKVLLKDKEGGRTNRYLRKIYKDPLVLSGKRDWLVIKSSTGVGIVGVKSRGTGTPFKTAGFPYKLKHFEDKTSYSDWEFKVEVAKVGKVQSKSGKRTGRVSH